MFHKIDITKTRCLDEHWRNHVLNKREHRKLSDPRLPAAFPMEPTGKEIHHYIDSILLYVCVSLAICIVLSKETGYFFAFYESAHFV